MGEKLSWQTAESLVRQNLATCYREFSLNDVAKTVRPHYSLAENLNRLRFMIRRPWMDEISGYALSYKYPLYICVEEDYSTYKMDRGVVMRSYRPQAMELRYFFYVKTVSKKLPEGVKSISLFDGHYTDNSVKSVEPFLRQLIKRRYENSNK